MDMNKIFCGIIITLITVSGSIVSTSLSFDTLEKNYSLLMLLTDQEHNEYVGVVSVKHLSCGDISCIKKTRCAYQRAVWNAISSLWDDALNPHDIGCYLVKGLLDENNPQKITLESDVSFAQLQKAKKIIGTIILEKNLMYLQGILIPQDLLMEFNLVAMLPEKECNFHESFDRELFDALPDLDYQVEEPSRLQVMVRQIGIALLLRCIDIRDYVAKSCNQVKKLLYSKIYERFIK